MSTDDGYGFPEESSVGPLTNDEKKKIRDALREPLVGTAGIDQQGNVQDAGVPRAKPAGRIEDSKSPLESRCVECGQIRMHQNHWAPFGWHYFVGVVAQPWTKTYHGFESIVDIEHDVNESLAGVIPPEEGAEWQGKLIVTVEYQKED